MNAIKIHGWPSFVSHSISVDLYADDYTQRVRGFTFSCQLVVCVLHVKHKRNSIHTYKQTYSVRWRITDGLGLNGQEFVSACQVVGPPSVTHTKLGTKTTHIYKFEMKPCFPTKLDRCDNSILFFFCLRMPKSYSQLCLEHLSAFSVSLLIAMARFFLLLLNLLKLCEVNRTNYYYYYVHWGVPNLMCGLYRRRTIQSAYNLILKYLSAYCEFWYMSGHTHI